MGCGFAVILVKLRCRPSRGDPDSRIFSRRRDLISVKHQRDVNVQHAFIDGRTRSSAAAHRRTVVPGGAPACGTEQRRGATIATGLPTITFINSSVWSIATTAQSSYPLNSENASPPGTFKLYLSSANIAARARTASASIAVAIVSIVLVFMAAPPSVRGLSVRRQEWGERCQQLLRRLLSNPVPAVRNDRALHVLSNQPHGVRDAFADGFASADGEHGQRQPALLALFVLRDRDVDRSIRRKTATQSVAA